MEPARGGKLSKLADAQELKLKELRPDETATAWALALGPVRTQLSANRDPWLAASAQAYLSSQEVQALEEAYNRGCEEFTLYTSLPLQDGTYPEPWPIRLAYYQTQWTAGSPYVLWDITRQPVANARLGQHWMTVEEWRYRGLLRATTLTDLRTQAVLTGASPSPSFVGSMSTIDPNCMTARGIKKPGTRTRTIASSGAFGTESALRNEFMNMVLK